MIMIEDLAQAAFQAAQNRDHEAVDRAVDEILSRGQFETDIAARAWMTRTITVIGCVTGGTINLKIEMVSDHSGTGAADTLPQVRQPDVAWAGGIFLAHARRDDDEWQRLWSAVPPRRIAVYVKRLLTTMAVTALAYEEDMGDDDKEGDQAAPRCGNPIHQWICEDRRTASRRIAKAHLN